MIGQSGFGIAVSDRLGLVSPDNLHRFNHHLPLRSFQQT